ncbi:MAG: flagellar basal body rod protein FlgB [candidate division Zixibacteria bacterium]|nr:flagellar basal body rod protein FlgB [candidate division Zixibacteria bacterium]
MSDLLNKAVFEKSGIPLLQRFLDIASIRHKLIAGNIANVSTPKYQSKDVDFQGELKKAVGNKNHLGVMTTNPGHIPSMRSREGSSKIIVNKSKDGNGINNVNADTEVANMAQNQIYYSIGATLLAKKFENLKTVIRSK